MIKAVIFDFFGVLVSEGWLPFKNKHFADDPGLFEKASQLNKLYDEGKLDYSKFILEVSELAGVSQDETRRWLRNNLPDEKLLDYIRDHLKPNYKLGLLSNAGGNWLGDLLTKDQVAMFDAISLSYESGVVKPDPRAYQLITNRLGVEPGESVFIDDQERYVTGARQQGMKAVVYKDLPQLKKDLAALLTADSDN